MTTTNGDNCVGLMQGTLVRPVARYPGSVVTDASLKVAANRVEATLRGNVGSGDTIFTLGDTSRIVQDMLLSIDSEIVSVSSVSGNNITVVRGFDGTQPSSHASGSVLKSHIDAWHHNALVAEVEAIEQALGPNLSNVGGSGGSGSTIIAHAYNFTPQLPGGNLIIGANVITLTPVPQGVNGTDKHHFLWIDQGTGTPEAVEITGGTAVSGAASGTVIVTCAFAHSGAWRISSATAGIEEALNLSRYVAVTQQVTTIHAPIWLADAHELEGVPIWGCEIKQASINTDCIWIGDNGAAGTVTAVVSGLVFSTTSAAWTSGWAINVRNAGRCEIRDCYIYGNNLIWGGINLYRAIQCNLWNNYIKATRSHAFVVSGQDAGNQSITCNFMHCETADIVGNPFRIGDWTSGLEFRDCIMNGCTTAAIYFGPAMPPGSGGGAQSNYFVSECDMEGAGVYAQNVGNLQIVNCWMSLNPAANVNPLKLTSSTDSVLFSSNLITGGAGSSSVPLVDTNGANVMIEGNHFNGGGTPEIPVMIAVGASAKTTSVSSNHLMIGGTGVQINAAAVDTAVIGNTFKSINVPVSGKGVNRYVVGNKGIDDVIATPINAAAIISPVNPVTIILGTTPINTITVPDTFSQKLTLLPVAGFTWTTAGNIRVAGTAVAGRALELVWDAVDSQWWPSYT